MGIKIKEWEECKQEVLNSTFYKDAEVITRVFNGKQQYRLSSKTAKRLGRGFLSNWVTQEEKVWIAACQREWVRVNSIDHW